MSVSETIQLRPVAERRLDLWAWARRLALWRLGPLVAPGTILGLLILASIFAP